MLPLRRPFRRARRGAAGGAARGHGRSRVDAVWFARGGYGSNRIAEAALADLPEARAAKLYMGYSDAGFLLAGFHKAGPRRRLGTDAAGRAARRRRERRSRRALDWLVRRDPAALEPELERPAMAFNLTVLSNLLGTPLEPDFTGVDLLIEEVERASLPDRPHDVPRHGQRRTSARSARLRLGRVGDISRNDPDFGARRSRRSSRIGARRSGIAYGGRADIGHDARNRVVPFASDNSTDFPLQRPLQRLSALRSIEDGNNRRAMMAQGTGRKAGGGLARPVQPSADLAQDHRQRSAAAQPGRFEGVGSHPQEQPAKPAKQTGNRRGRQAEEDLRGQGPGQHVRDEQAPVEPSEVDASAGLDEKGIRFGGSPFHCAGRATRHRRLSRARGRRAAPASPDSRDRSGW